MNEGSSPESSWSRWREAVSGLLANVYIEDEARLSLERQFLDGHPSLFADVMADWTEAVEQAERVARLAAFLARRRAIMCPRPRAATVQLLLSWEAPTIGMETWASDRLDPRRAGLRRTVQGPRTNPGLTARADGGGRAQFADRHHANRPGPASF